MSEKNIFDVAVIGGGINGAGIAADAALRGLSVLLVEQGDFGSGTSSASTKLIHGGLRYLESYEFRLVAEGLKEREILLSNAKHLVKPLNFILPHQPTSRSIFEIRLGLFLYDHLARRSSLKKTKLIKFNKHLTPNILKSTFTTGFQYTDCKTDDARLVVTNALQAQQQGATIFTYTECIQASRKSDYWEINLTDQRTKETFTKKSHVLINATGPWVNDFLQDKLQLRSQHKIELVKGSHIVVPKFYPDDVAFIIQHTDKRVIFLIPYLTKFTLIGTTDVRYHGKPGPVSIMQEETDYLLGAVNTYFTAQLTPEDIIYTYAGLRPLLKSHTDNPAAITRDYAIEIDNAPHQPALISLFGGKLTTYRSLAQKVVDKLQPFFPHLSSSKTAMMPLPGSNYMRDATLLRQAKISYSWLEEELLARYLNQYGTHTFWLLARCNNYTDLGKNFGANLYQREVDYLIKHEWAHTAEDILWRRTKLGYTYPQDRIKELNDYLSKHTQTF